MKRNNVGACNPAAVFCGGCVMRLSRGMKTLLTWSADHIMQEDRRIDCREYENRGSVPYFPPLFPLFPQGTISCGVFGQKSGGAC